jgi:DNA topoisomerase-1
VYLKVGRFGPYVQRGAPDVEEKPQNASLLKGMDPANVTLEVALRLLSLPRELGKDATNGEPIVAQNGRFGPYVKCGSETRSLPADLSPLDVSFEQAVELLAQPKAARRGFGAAREPLRVLDESPVTKEKIQLFSGRYGPYVTDGVTNASVPKDVQPEELTQQQALDLLAARAALGPSKKTRGRRGAATKGAAKSAPPKSPSKAKKAPIKKTAAKKKSTKKTSTASE